MPTPNLPSTFGGWAMMLVGIIGIIGVLYVMVGVSGVAIPYWLVQIFWIVCAVIVVVAAIRFIMWMTGSP